MPLVIMKLAIEASTIPTVSPLTTKFFTVVSGDVAEGSTFTVDPAEFFDDAGNTPAVLPALNPGNATTKLYINGVLQMDGIYTYTPGITGEGSLVVTVPATGSTLNGSPIVLEVVNYVPTAITNMST